MSRCLCVVMLAAAFVWVAPAGASSIPISNSGFETDVLACAGGPGCFDPNVIPSWGPTGATATFKPSTGAGGEYPAGIPEGVNVAALGASVSGSILQTLAATLQADTLYTLTLSVEQRADFGFTGYDAELLAGGVTLSSDSSLSPAPGTFLTDVIVFSSGPSPAQLGQSLAISISSLGAGQVDVDKVSLDVSSPSTVPEPASLILFGSGLAVAGGFHRRRRRMATFSSAP